MGYPMSYRRVVGRNHLSGGYDSPIGVRLPDAPVLAGFSEARCNHPSIAGDLRRLEKDQRDDAHVAKYAELSGATPEQVRKILDLFFDGLTW